MKLYRQLGICDNAAWCMHLKRMQVMLVRNHACLLGRFIQLDDAYLDVQRSGGKRGRGADARTPYVAVVETKQGGALSRIKRSLVKGSCKRKTRHWSRQHGKAGSMVVCDALICFHTANDAGCVH